MKKFITTGLVLSTLAFAPISALAQEAQPTPNPNNTQFRSGECINNGVRKYDGTGMKNGQKNKGNNQNKGNCTQVNCPNYGVRPLDGTGFKKGQNK